MKGNVIVGQSGGPTAVINSSIAGVYRTAIDRGAKKVYGMLHGIQGFLDEKYVDLSDQRSGCGAAQENPIRISGFLQIQAAGDPRGPGYLREDLRDFR